LQVTYACGMSPATNRLSKETSPYLLQHQHNPVDWYAWGEEAFTAARQQHKPIFLSVGYSTCYWCHVMERQSFENDAIAGLMNELFINIKVDREERPDVDQLYMTAVQVMTRQGGWPMSVFLLPDLRPFYGGTYFPPADAYGRPGFPTLLRALADAFHNRRGDVEKSAAQLVTILGQLAGPEAPSGPVHLDTTILDTLIRRSTADYDSHHGGFGAAPKFPRQTLLELLLVHHRTSPDAQQLAMLTHTLDAMAHGGIRDQLGGGFHRYSTDAQWLVPHFEIMLYDNAMLGWCYAEAFAQTQDPRYAAVARGIFDFILREMTSPAGAFYTALDAEVDGQEGLNYLWTADEVRQSLADALGTDGTAAARIDRFCRLYGLDDGPNFADPHHGNGRAEKNILHLPADADTGPDSPLLDDDLATLRTILRTERQQRKQPLLDTKIITSWNALMIRGLAHAGLVLGEGRYLAAAAKAALFLLDNHRTADGTLRRTSRDGVVKHPGFLDDYAFLAEALLSLHQATREPRWRAAAESIVSVMLLQFGDDAGPGLFFSGKDDASLILRQKLASDSPLPSGNAVAARALLALGDAQRSRQIIAAFAEPLQQNAEGMSAMLQAAMLAVLEAGAFEAGQMAGTAEGGATESAAARPVSPALQARELVSLEAHWADARSLRVRARIAPGHHINAHPAGPGLIQTQLRVTSSAASPPQVTYPPPQMQSLAFAEQPIPVYSGQADFLVHWDAAPTTSTNIVLTYQACDDRACLPPATKAIAVTPWPG
jgi:uncharacterized protein YyaL (SSP411 family)